MATSLDKYRDIFDKKAFCHLATVGRDGKPQVTPVWCDFDGTHVRINTARGRVKDKNLKANRSSRSPCRTRTTRIATCRCAGASWR